MRFFSLVTASAIAASVVLAAPMPLIKRDAASDQRVLNFALSLEHLEAEFYKQGLERYDANDFVHAGLSHKAHDRFTQISAHESTHVATLETAIKNMGGTPVLPCKYKFPVENVYDFVAIARVLENTGVSAYLGAAADLNGDLLTTAASITTVEARHSAFLNEVLGQSSAPYPFDTPLSVKQVFTIASNFIESCPYDLGVAPFKQLWATLPPKGEYKVETSFEDEDPHKTTWCQFLYNNKVVVSPRRECALPKTVTGYVYVVITDTATPIAFKDDSNILAGPALLFQGDH